MIPRRLPPESNRWINPRLFPHSFISWCNFHKQKCHVFSQTIHGFFQIEEFTYSAMPIHEIRIAPQRLPNVHFNLMNNRGLKKNPPIEVDSISLMLNHRRWLGVMGEIHYSRLEPSQWEESLAKMKAGGIDIIASYTFWIHHEEQEGCFNWAGRRNLRHFVECCQQFDLPVIIRCGPWCHGEVRNGGLPDWVLDRHPRSLNKAFLLATQKWYEQIAHQLQGLLWKDDGPVIGIQLDNEYGGPAEYLLRLKSIAQEVGLEVPIYTRTGWPSTSTPMPFGEMFPLFGAYAEGFWDRELTSMPGNYWKAFCFEPMRTDTQIGFDQLGPREAKDDPDTPQYPYLTCELGGGMEQSYHRRLRIDALDVLAVALTRLGSGSNLPGYYMYHGGINPRGRTPLHESQATRYYNDVPEISYDFQAPLGSFSQMRLHYHLLRRLHLFLRDFGESLAPLLAVFPDRLPSDRQDTSVLRFALRGGTQGGYLFVNNYQRGLSMPDHVDTQFELQEIHTTNSIRIPLEPVTIPANTTFFWPISFDLKLATLCHATAQPICKVHRGNRVIFYFAQTVRGLTEFFFRPANGTTIESDADIIHLPDNRYLIRAEHSHKPIFVLRSTPPNTLTAEVVLLNESDSLKLWKLPVFSADRDQAVALLCEHDLWVDAHGKLCMLHETSLEEQPVVHLRRPPSSPRLPRMGSQGVAEAPDHSAWETAAEYFIQLPPHQDRNRYLLRVDYRGDILRFYSDDKLILDDFYNGDSADLLLSLIPAHVNGVTIRILPLHKDAPILIPDRDILFKDQDVICDLQSARLIERRLENPDPASLIFDPKTRQELV